MRIDSEQRGLGVEGIEDGLDQEEVGSSVQESPNRVSIGRHQLVEAHVPEAWIVHIG
jgi:hypothetical protein